MFRQSLKIDNRTALPPPGSAGQLRTYFHPRGVRIHDITMYVTHGQTGSLGTPAPATKQQIIDTISRIRLMVGTTTIRDINVAQLLSTYEILGRAQDVPGALTLYMSNPQAASVLGEETTAWDLISNPVPEVQIELTLNIPPAGTAFDIIMESSVDSLRSLLNGQYIGRFIRAETATDQIGAGRSSYFLLQRNRPWSRLWLFAATLPERVILRLNGEDIYDITQTALKPELAAHLGKFGKKPLLNADGTVKTVWPILLNPDEQLTNLLNVTPRDRLELITEGMAASAQYTFVTETQSAGIA